MSTLPRPAELLSAHPIFSGVDPTGIEAFSMMMELTSFSPGETIVRQGEAADTLFVFASGEADVRHRDDAGTVRHMGQLGPGDALGQTALNHEARRSADVVARTPVETYALDLHRFGDLREHGHANALAVLEGLARVLAARIRSVAADIQASLDLSPPVHSPTARPPGRPRPASQTFAALLPLLPQFQGISEARVHAALPYLQEWSVPAGAKVFEEGSTDRSCFIIVRGSVEVCIERTGQRRRLAQFGPGRSIGELGLFDDLPRNVTCIATEPTVLLELSRTRFGTLRTMEPPSATALMHTLNRSLADSVALAYATLRPLTPGSLDVPPLPEHSSQPSTPNGAARTWSEDQLVQRVRTARLGHDLVVTGPFGPRRVVFADHLGGARPLDFLEDVLRSELLHRLGNPGPAPRGLGQASTVLREEARSVVLDAVHAGPGDVAWFTGYGAVGALDALLEALNLHIPVQIDRLYRLRDRIPEAERPVVFLSEDLAEPLRARWTRSLAEVVDIPPGADGRPSFVALSAELEAHAHRPFRLACFPMVSARTGLCADDVAINTLLHQHGALAIWDASGALADAPIDMPPRPDHRTGPLAYADALLIDPSTCPGGMGCPGVLVGRQELLADLLSDHQSIPGAEGNWLGLPDHGAVLRTALVFQLRAALDPARAGQRTRDRIRMALDRWSDTPGVRIDGDLDSPRLATVSLALESGGLVLPASLALTLLDDLFGIQARELQGQDTHFAVNFAWYLSNTEFQYICAAVVALAEDGWRMARAYQRDHNRWSMPDARRPTPIRLADFRYQSGSLEIHASRTLADESVLDAQLKRGCALLGPRAQRAVGS